MNLLLVHQNFPGQFQRIALAPKIRSAITMTALTDFYNPQPAILPLYRYYVDPGVIGSPPALAQSYVVKLARGEAAAMAMLHMRRSGYEPDIVLGHIGWGETLFVKDVWPKARLGVHAEFYYSSAGADVGFDPEFSERDSAREAFRVRSSNTPLMAAMLDADFAVAPTFWQSSRFPAEVRSKIQVVHEGVDTQAIRPDPNVRFPLSTTGKVLTAADEVVTYVSRNLEPYRGYHTFMRALPRILAARPRAQVVIVGGDGVSYGAPPPRGETRSWREIFLAEVAGRLPLDRVHFTGRVSHADFVALMQISAAHVYLTYPFVLSWSVLEAMSAGALVIGSRTAPVAEVLAHGENGLLVDFFDAGALADTVVAALARPRDYRHVRAAARETIVKRFDAETVCLPKWLSLLQGVVARPAAVVTAVR